MTCCDETIWNPLLEDPIWLKEVYDVYDWYSKFSYVDSNRPTVDRLVGLSGILTRLSRQQVKSD